jgi:hypothetical protein
MDLDAVEQRYLLTGAADSTLKAFDVLVRAHVSSRRQGLQVGHGTQSLGTPLHVDAHPAAS